MEEEVGKKEDGEKTDVPPEEIPATEKPIETVKIGDGERDDFAKLLDRLKISAKESVDSYQGEGPREIKINSIYSDSFSGFFCETDKNGNPVLFATKRQETTPRTFMGIQVEAVTKGRAIGTISIDTKKTPKVFDITHKAGELLLKVIPEAKDAGDKVQAGIDEKNDEYFPVLLTPAEKNIVAQDLEPDPDLNMVIDLVAYTYGETTRRLGDKAKEIKVGFLKLTEHRLYADFLGCQTDMVLPRVSFVINVTTKKGNNTYGVIRGAGGTIKEILGRYLKEDATESEREPKAIISKLVDEVIKDAIDLDRAQTTAIIGASECPVILDPNAGGVFVHEVYGHTAESDIICENRKRKDAGIRLKARIGSQVSDYPNFSMIDTPEQELKIDNKTLTKYNWGALPVDGYGNRGKIIKIVKDGIMTGVLVDRHTLNEIIHNLKNPELIKETGVTGNVRRENFEHLPLIRMRNTLILPDPNGPSSKEEMAKLIPATKKGLFVKRCNGGSINTDSGDWQKSANLCYLIENGTITDKPIKNVTIFGNVKQTDLIELIGNAETMDRTFTGWCGKDDQTVPVEGGAPLIYIKSARLGGGSTRPWVEEVEDYRKQRREVMEGKRGAETIDIPEFREMAGPNMPQNKICLVSLILPWGEELNYLKGSAGRFCTHEISEAGELIKKIRREKVNQKEE